MEAHVGLNLWEILIILLIAVIVFGAGRLPQVMGDVAKGVRAFKQGLKDDAPAAPPATGTDRRTDA